MPKKRVIYPKGLDVANAMFIAFKSGESLQDCEFVEDTSGALVNNLIVYDEPDIERQASLPPLIDLGAGLPKPRFMY